PGSPCRRSTSAAATIIRAAAGPRWRCIGARDRDCLRLTPGLTAPKQRFVSRPNLFVLQREAMTLKLYVLLTAIAAATFLLFPQIDVAVSGWFWNPRTAWELGYSPVLGAIHNGVPYMLAAVMLAAIAVFAINLRRGTDILQLRTRGMVFVVLALLLGP